MPTNPFVTEIVPGSLRERLEELKTPSPTVLRPKRREFDAREFKAAAKEKPREIRRAILDGSVVLRLTKAELSAILTLAAQPDSSVAQASTQSGGILATLGGLLGSAAGALVDLTQTVTASLELDSSSTETNTGSGNTNNGGVQIIIINNNDGDDK